MEDDSTMLRKVEPEINILYYLSNKEGKGERINLPQSAIRKALKGSKSSIEVTRDLEAAKEILEDDDAEKKPSVIISNATASELEEIVKVSNFIPVISTHSSYNFKNIEESFEAGAIDVVSPNWLLNLADRTGQEYLTQLAIAMKNAHMINTTMRSQVENGGEPASPIDIRKNFNYGVALLFNKNKDNSTPHFEDICKGIIESYQFRLLPVRELEEMAALAKYVHPNLSVIPLVALDGNHQAEVKETVNTLIRENENCKNLFVCDGKPPNYLTELRMEKPVGSIAVFRRPNGLDALQLDLKDIMGSKQRKVDEATIKLFEKYLIENKEDPRDLTVDPSENKKLLLRQLQEPAGGKYGVIYFCGLHNREHDELRKFVVKRNRGDEEDAKMVTMLEARVLNELKNMDLPVVESCTHQGNRILMKYLPGDTVAGYMLKRQTIPPEIMQSIITTMPKIHMALESLVKPGSSTFSESDIQFLKDRKIRMVKKDMPDYISEEEIKKNFYAYRVMQAAGAFIPELLGSYRNINDTLINSETTWIGYDHIRNRIVHRMGDNTPFIVTAYDFNHMQEAHFGLDLAMVFSDILPFKARRHMEFLNYVNQGILCNYLAHNGEDLEEGKKAMIQNLLDNLSTITADKPSHYKDYYEKVPFNRIVYGNNDLIRDVACTYAAFMHRMTLNLVTLVNKINDGDTELEGIAKSYGRSIKFIGNLTRIFESKLNDEQRRMLEDNKVYLPIGYDALKPLTKHKSRKFTSELKKHCPYLK